MKTKSHKRSYSEIMVYGWTLPDKGIYFRHIEGLILDNVTVESYRTDVSENFVFEDITGEFIVKKRNT